MYETIEYTLYQCGTLIIQIEKQKKNDVVSIIGEENLHIVIIPERRILRQLKVDRRLRVDKKSSF